VYGSQHQAVSETMKSRYVWRFTTAYQNKLIATQSAQILQSSSASLLSRPKVFIPNDKMSLSDGISTKILC
jgi:hypothetical protein